MKIKGTLVSDLGERPKAWKFLELFKSSLKRDPMLQATELATQLLGAQEAICCVMEDLSAQDFADLRCHHQRSSLMLVSAQLQ